MQDQPKQYAEMPVLFVLLMGSALIVTVCLVMEFLPRPISLEDFLDAPPPQKRSLLHRLFSTRDGKSALRNQPDAQGPQEHVTQTQVVGAAAPGELQTVSSRDQALFRQAHMAHQLLVRGFGHPIAEAKRSLARIPTAGSFRAYEEMRFHNDLVWMDLPFTESPAILAELDKNSRWLVNRPEAFFEDQFHAGLGALNAGNATDAIAFLQAAMDAWPVADRSYGSVHLGLVTAYAADGQLQPVLLGLEDFKRVYPDWLYIELFSQDLAELHAIYGEAPVLCILRARLSQLVHDDKTALALYQRGLRGTSQDGVDVVRQWLAEVEVTKPR